MINKRQMDLMERAGGARDTTYPSLQALEPLEPLKASRQLVGYTPKIRKIN